jgi:hypothetical protein
MFSSSRSSSALLDLRCGGGGQAVARTALLGRAKTSSLSKCDKLSEALKEGLARGRSEERYAERRWALSVRLASDAADLEAEDEGVARRRFAGRVRPSRASSKEVDACMMERDVL